jgi:hypothetical protein
LRLKAGCASGLMRILRLNSTKAAAQLVLVLSSAQD